MPMLQQTTVEVSLAGHKRRHQRAGVAVLMAIPTNSRRIPSRTALNIASAGNPNYCLLTNRGSSGECRMSFGLVWVGRGLVIGDSIIHESGHLSCRGGRWATPGGGFTCLCIVVNAAVG